MKTLKAIAAVIAIMSPAIILLAFHEFAPKPRLRAAHWNSVNNIVKIRGPLTNSASPALLPSRPQG